MKEVQPSGRRKGVVGVVVREERLLVIRRSNLVRAPGKFCFPGGGMEPGESEPEALRRELQEELGVSAEPLRLLWRSTTPWQVELAWWHAELHSDELVPASAEVASVHWLTIPEIRKLPGLLPSNHEFLDAWQTGLFDLGALERPSS